MRPLFALGVLFVLLLSGCSPSTPTPAASPSNAPGLDQAVSAYRTWVLDQVDQLTVKTQEFTDAVLAGDRKKAQSLYAAARLPYERIEPIAEALGDLDPRIDARDGDVPADQWGGFHKLEKILWSDTVLESARGTAQTLARDVGLLRAKVENTEITPAQMANGAVELLNEVAKTKVTGEEERYSRTDLWDFQGNVDGALKIFQLLEGPVRAKDSALANTLDNRFTALNGLLAAHKKGEGFVAYGELKEEQTRALASAVDAAADPLGRVAQVLALNDKGQP